MANVTNVLLKTSTVENIEPLNSRLRESGFFWSQGRPFQGVRSRALPNFWYAGTRPLECEFYPAAFNFLDIAELVGLVESVEWEYPEDVQLFVQHQESATLKELPLRF